LSQPTKHYQPTFDLLLIIYRYLVDFHWFKQWKKYVGFDTGDQSGAGDEQNNPGPIYNSGLFQADAFTLKEHLRKERDYTCMLLPEEGWFKLVSWYGVTSDQQALPRKVVEHGPYRKNLTVEVYLREVKLSQYSDPQTLITREFRGGDTIGHVMSEMKKVFNIPQDTKTRVWYMNQNNYMSYSMQLLTNLEQKVQDADLFQGQVLIIEQKNEDGTWPIKSVLPVFWDEMIERRLIEKHKENNSKTKKAAAKKAPLKRNDILEPKPSSNDSSRSSGKVLVNIYRIIL